MSRSPGPTILVAVPNCPSDIHQIISSVQKRKAVDSSIYSTHSQWRKNYEHILVRLTYFKLSTRQKTERAFPSRSFSS